MLEELNIKDKVDIGKIKCRISTVKLPSGQFETMVFKSSSWQDLYCEYNTERYKAIRRHHELLLLMENGIKFWGAEKPCQ